MRNSLKSRNINGCSICPLFLITFIMQSAPSILQLYHIPVSPVFQLPGRQNGQSQTGYRDHSLGTLLGCAGDEIVDPHAGMVLVPAGSSWLYHLFPLLHWTWKPQSYAETPGLLNTHRTVYQKEDFTCPMEEIPRHTDYTYLLIHLINNDTRKQKKNQPFPRQHTEVLKKTYHISIYTYAIQQGQSTQS